MHSYNDELYHWGIKGMKWGVRRYQNKDGTLTAAGRSRSVGSNAEGTDEKSQKRVGLSDKQKRALKKRRASLPTGILRPAVSIPRTSIFRLSRMPINTKRINLRNFLSGSRRRSYRPRRPILTFRRRAPIIRPHKAGPWINALKPPSGNAKASCPATKTRISIIR